MSEETATQSETAPVELSAGVLIIGAEVLSAKVQDENGPFLLGRLHGLGVDVPRLCTVADQVDDIVWGLRELRRRCDWVITAGGIGPTHDDVTIMAVAAALGRRVVRNAELEVLLRQAMGDRATPESFRMADVVEGTELVATDATRLPVLVVDRTIILPGVPALLRRQFDVVAPRLLASPFVLKQVFLGVGESAIAAVLDSVAKAHPTVAIGSYPRFESDADHKVKLTLESRERGAVEVALAALLEAPRGERVAQRVDNEALQAPGIVRNARFEGFQEPGIARNGLDEALQAAGDARNGLPGLLNLRPEA